MIMRGDPEFQGHPIIIEIKATPHKDRLAA